MISIVEQQRPNRVWNIYRDSDNALGATGICIFLIYVRASLEIVIIYMFLHSLVFDAVWCFFVMIASSHSYDYFVPILSD